MEQNNIETKTITELLGMNFYIPDYQRGYRWTSHNVKQLLNDIWDYRQNPNSRNTFYCLQPVVVRKTKWIDLMGNEVSGFELIDGQQRLTTIHRIITYLLLEHLDSKPLQSEGYSDELFSIFYQTRLESNEFLESNNEDLSKPDLFFMSKAYESIKNWFEDGQKGIARQIKDDVLKILLPGIILNNGEKQLPELSIQIIWYEINDTNQKSEELFTRLNRGKIPLTSAELIKAKFVNTDSFNGITQEEKIVRRTQLVQIWDEIENQLNSPKFWAFISNHSMSQYSNKIEYLFDIITEKRSTEKDPLFSFIHFFSDIESAESLWSKWMRVEEIYRSLIFWYSNKNYYHKIGYLIASGISIGNLINEKKKLSKSELELEIDKLIANTIDENWEDLNYSKSGDNEKIIRVLLLANIELIRTNSNINEFFPFEMYKSMSKSLEHVHAQNIEGINENRKEDWFNWLNLHTSILVEVSPDKTEAEKIIIEYDSIDQKSFRFDDFKLLSERILKLIPNQDINENEYLHKIENMALLGLSENISLSNSVFEVKRKKIIEMDRSGSFIPVATKRIFLKYYTSGAESNSIWTLDERQAYLDEIKLCIENYKKHNLYYNEN